MSTNSSVMASQERKRKNSAPVLTSKRVSKISAIAKPGSSERDDSSEVDLLLSQTDTNSCSQPIIELSCGVCKQPTSMDTIQVTCLQCCLCKVNYHGACLNVSDTSLLDFLYVVSGIGGWCCPLCRHPGKPGSQVRIPLTGFLRRRSMPSM